MDFGGGASAAKEAANIQSQAAERAAQLQWQMYQQARTDVAPWLKAGGAGLQQYAGLLGLPGYTALDPTATLKATPGYEWMLGQGVGALDRSAAARGMNLSGPQAKALTDYGQNLAMKKAWDPYMDRLGGLSSQGLGAGTRTGQWGMQTGAQMGEDYMAGAQAQAQGLYNAYGAQKSGLGNLFGGLGMLGSLALAPFTGGASLLGLGLSGLGGLMGGGPFSGGSAYGYVS